MEWSNNGYFIYVTSYTSLLIQVNCGYSGIHSNGTQPTKFKLSPKALGKPFIIANLYQTRVGHSCFTNDLGVLQ